MQSLAYYKSHLSINNIRDRQILVAKDRGNGVSCLIGTRSRLRKTNEVPNDSFDISLALTGVQGIDRLRQFYDVNPADFRRAKDIYQIFAQASHKNSVKISVEDLEITIQRINKLKEDEDEDEYGEITMPTEHATQKAIDLASESAKLLSERFTKAWVSTENSGGIRLTWARVGLNKEVRLIIPATADKQTCLYHEIGDEYGVDYNVSAKTISTWLRWFNN